MQRRFQAKKKFLYLEIRKESLKKKERRMEFLYWMPY